MNWCGSRWEGWHVQRFNCLHWSGKPGEVCDRPLASSRCSEDLHDAARCVAARPLQLGTY
eukprot:3707971-Amphidinium_carterae.2